MKIPKTIGQRELLLWAQWTPEEIDTATPNANRQRAFDLRRRYKITAVSTPRKGTRYDAKEVAAKLNIRISG